VNRTRIIGNELLKRGTSFFSLAQIVKATGLNRIIVRDTLLTFHSKGFLRRVHKTLEPYSRGKGPPLMNIRYKVIMPSKLAAKIAPAQRGKRNSADRMWFIIREKKIFTRRDLCVLAGASKEYARWFTKMLHRAGIISLTDRGEWSLVKDPGARRPYIGDMVRAKKIPAYRNQKSGH